MKTGIVGVGAVGSAAAYAMVLQRTVGELVLVDHNTKLAVAQAHDITDATPFTNTAIVRAGDYAELAGADVVVICAGVAQKPGDTRLDLLKRNAEVFAAIIPAILKAAPNTILLIATNPVDVMTDIAFRISGLPAARVIGSGTILDSARFRSLLSQHLGVAAKSVHAYVLGEHGDSEVLWWSGATLGGVSIIDAAAQLGKSLGDKEQAVIDESVRRAAYHIIDGKGATWFGIGAGLSRLVQAIGRDENLLLSVSSRLPEVEGIKDVTLSVPCIVGGRGMISTLTPKLDEKERTALRRSAEILKTAAESVGVYSHSK
jgi:L-lactate dehydrogenase